MNMTFSISKPKTIKPTIKPLDPVIQQQKQLDLALVKDTMKFSMISRAQQTGPCKSCNKPMKI